ncbi:MAG: glycosyltransferase [Paludibacteraceae bacterium]|nr:glycosyltransferase [Paludibacteraceae bacterium]
MKILFVIDSFYTTNNGTSISAQRFAGELRKRGHEVKALCWDSPKDLTPALSQGEGENVRGTKDVQREEVESQKSKVESPSVTDGDFTTEKFHMPVFQPLMDKHDFSFAHNDTETVHEACDWADVVHIFVPFGISMEAVTYCNSIGKPVTAAFHIQPENMTSSVNMGKVEWFNEMFYRSFRSNIYNRVRHVHVPSKFMGDMIAERGYTAKIHPISNGIQNEFLEAGQRFIDHGRPAKSAELEGKIVITMVGRLSGEKRQDVLINAVPYSKYADQIQLAFAGKGPKYDEYVALGEKLKNKPMFLYLSREELIQHLGMTDLYVHASDMESEAISCIEAFATGLVPVIANSEVSATPQFALDGRSLFMPGNPKDLARAIDYWLDHPNERKYIGELYYQSAKRYTLENSVTQFEQMLQEEIEDCEKSKVESQKSKDEEAVAHSSIRLPFFMW